jgi:hypothetical protein
VQNKFNVSIASVTTTTSGSAKRSREPGRQRQAHVDSCLREVVRFIDGLEIAELGERLGVPPY